MRRSLSSEVFRREHLPTSGLRQLRAQASVTCEVILFFCAIVFWRFCERKLLFEAPLPEREAVEGSTSLNSQK